MVIDPIAIIFFTVTVSVLAAVIFFLARSFAKTAERLHEMEKANNNIQSQLSEQPMKLLEEAHKKSQEIIDLANKQANEILASSKVYENNSNQALKDKLAMLEKQ